MWMLSPAFIIETAFMISSQETAKEIYIPLTLARRIRTLKVVRLMIFITIRRTSNLAWVGHHMTHLRRFDGEFPDKYFKEIMEYFDMKPERFMELCEQFCSLHLWEKENGAWRLRKTLWEN